MAAVVGTASYGWPWIPLPGGFSESVGGLAGERGEACEQQHGGGAGNDLHLESS